MKHIKYCVWRQRFCGWDKVDANRAVYTDGQIEAVLDQALNHTDLNNDGYIDYLEYRISNLKAQIKK